MYCSTSPLDADAPNRIRSWNLLENINNMSFDVIGINILADKGRQGFLPDIFWKLVCVIEELHEEAYGGHSRLDFVCIRGPRAALSIF